MIPGDEGASGGLGRAFGRLGTVAALAAAAAALVYVNALGNGFALDDPHIVLENPALRSLASLPQAVWEPYWPGEGGRELGLWRPLTTATLGLVWAVGADDPFPYHLLNVLLHAATTAAIVVLLARLVVLPAALLAGLVFAVHPVHVEAVANVVGVAELLSALLFTLASLVYLDGSPPGRPPAPPDETEEAGRASPSEPTSPSRDIGAFAVPGSGRSAAVLLLYAGAFLAKEGAVVLPLVLVLLDGARASVPLSRLRGYLAPRLALFLMLGVVAVAVLLARYTVLWSLADPLPPLGADLLGEIPRVWSAATVWAEYARLLVFPLDLAADYSPPMIPVLTVWTARGVLGVVLALGTAAVSLALWRRSAPLARGGDSARVLAFGAVWLLVTLAPVSNLFFLSGVLLAERTLYLPSVGLAVAAGWLLFRLWRRWRLAGLVLSSLLLGALALRTVARNPTWASTDTVLTRLILDHPENGRARWALGDLQETNGRLLEANGSYRLALDQLDMNYRLTLNVARRLLNQGRDRPAEALLHMILEKQPGTPNAPELLAVLHERRGHPAESERWARLTAALDPESAVAWHVLANSLEAQGRVGEAARAREQVIRRGEGRSWQQWFSLARLRRMSGDPDGALGALDSARARAGDDALRRTIDSLFVATPPDR